MELLRAHLESLRPPHSLLMGAVAVAGMILSQNTTASPVQLMLTFASAFLFPASSFSVNDLFDIELDKVNKPGRPLP